MQRLFGVSLVLSAQQPLTDEQRERCRTEMVEALGDLRSALERPLAVSTETGTTLRAEIARLTLQSGLPVRLAWPDGVEVPRRLEGVAQSVLAEGLRNARKHADPTRVDLVVQRDEDTFSLEIRNDGVMTGEDRPSPPGVSGTGMGLRLAAFEALQHGGFVEFGADKTASSPGWRVRLVAPVAGREETR
jgi:signal transduction histidine kinase